MDRFSSAQSAYISILGRLREHGTAVPGVTDALSVGSQFGVRPRGTRELLGYAFQLDNPRNRIVDCPSRPLSLRALAANVIWTIGGGHDFSMIHSYNPKARQFARDESHFEAAFGARLFSPGQQLRAAERRLINDRPSRRASAMIYWAEDSLVDRLDVPCAIALQFLVRRDALVCVAMMRSQSAAMVMPYDIFLFTVIQEILAVRLQIPLGPYIHIAGSIHYYEEEMELVDQLLGDPLASPAAMRPMARADDHTLEELVHAEQAIRHARRLDIGPIAMGAFGLDEYWLWFLSLLDDEPR